jgi:hypothetical protein
MPATPTPRPAKLTIDQISNTMEGQGRETPHGPVRLHLALTMVYRSTYPYDVNIVIAPQQRLTCGHDPARWAVSRAPWCAVCDLKLSPWLVSREVLCNAAMWETPAGMGDFRAIPMAETVTQLVFIASDPEHNGESLYVDVQRLSLLSFLERTMRLVKPGRESKHMGMDQLVAALLGSDTR